MLQQWEAAKLGSPPSEIERWGASSPLGEAGGVLVLRGGLTDLNNMWESSSLPCVKLID